MTSAPPLISQATHSRLPVEAAIATADWGQRKEESGSSSVPSGAQCCVRHIRAQISESKRETIISVVLDGPTRPLRVSTLLTKCFIIGGCESDGKRPGRLSSS